MRTGMKGCVMWYTVWDAKTEQLVACGTAGQCARMLGYKNGNVFASAVSHNRDKPSRKYDFLAEKVRRSELDDL